MLQLTLVSKKEILAGQTYEFEGHTIVCESWTERGKNGSNVAAQFIGSVDGKHFKGSVTDLKKKVGANVLAKSDKGTPIEIFATYLANMRKIVGLPSYYLAALDTLEGAIEEARKQEEAAAALQEREKAAKVLGFSSLAEYEKAIAKAKAKSAKK